MKKALIIVAVILVLAGIGSVMNKSDAKKAAAVETRAMAAETVAPTATPKPTAKPTPKPTATPEPELVAIEAGPAATEEPVTRSAEKTYVLNTNTGKFHKPTCSSVSQMKDKNKLEFTGTREDVIGMGYEPCGKCHP